jgi:hypothetical protein
VAPELELAATEPPFPRFATGDPFLAHQPHAPVADRGTEGEGLTLPQREAGRGRRLPPRGRQAAPHWGPHLMPPRPPVLVRGQGGKGAPPMPSDQARGLLESSHGTPPAADLSSPLRRRCTVGGHGAGDATAPAPGGASRIHPPSSRVRSAGGLRCWSEVVTLGGESKVALRFYTSGLA